MLKFVSAILIIAASALQAAAQQHPMSPPEKSPVPLKVGEEDSSKRGEPGSDKKKNDDEHPSGKILVPTTLAGHHISSGNPAIDVLVQEAASRNGLDPCLIISVMRAESGFNKSAVSPKGASGLMQLMPETASRFGVRNIFDPRENILAGATYLRWLLDRFGGDVRLALAGYNAGEGSVEFYGNRIPPFLETQNYVRTIYTRYSTLHLGKSTVAPVAVETPHAPGSSPSESLPTYNQIIRFTSSSGDKSGK